MAKGTKRSAASTKTVGINIGINIGISEKDRSAIAGGLSKLLADTYTLYLTTHNFHWNVTGPMLMPRLMPKVWVLDALLFMLFAMPVFLSEWVPALKPSAGTGTAWGQARS